jgi:hypothetical protein
MFYTQNSRNEPNVYRLKDLFVGNHWNTDK